MRCLITGVSGFVGRALAAGLVARGHAVGGTYVEQKPPELGIELYRADLLDRVAIGEAVRRFHPDRVAHLAGLSHVGESFGQPDAYRRVNVTGTENLMRAAAGLPVVLASSSEVYGSVPENEQPIGEGRLPSPQSPYGESKVAAERLVLGAGGVAVRCFNIIGPGQDPSFALPSFARQLAAIQDGSAEPVLKVGNLDVRRDFVHLDDAVDGYAVILERGEPGGVYNLGTGRAHRLAELLERLIAISGLKLTVEVDPAKFRPADAELRVADIARLEALGWEPKRDLDDALRAIWAGSIGSPLSLSEPADRLAQ